MYHKGYERSVELWSPEGVRPGSCTLKDYPREMNKGPTANLVSGKLVACFGRDCEIYNNGEWNHLVKTREICRKDYRRAGGGFIVYKHSNKEVCSPVTRKYHSSLTTEDGRLLLIGGWYSKTTGWIPIDGSPSQPGPFKIRHQSKHCTLQISNEIIIVTGGMRETATYVTEYRLTGDGNETPLPPLTQPRMDHACGVYRGAGGEQVRRVCS